MLRLSFSLLGAVGFWGKAGFGAVLGGQLCFASPSRAAGKWECGGFFSTSSLGDRIRHSLPRAILSINSPRIPNYLLLPAWKERVQLL